MKRTRTVSERLLAMALCLVLFIGMMPGGVPMARAEESVQYGTITAMDGTLEVIPGENGALKATNTETITLNYAASNPGWWAGIKLEAPADLTAEQLAAATYEIGGVQKSFATYKDGDNFIWLYCKVSPELIGKDDNGYLNCTWNFTWAEGRTQAVSVEIDTSKVILMQDGAQVYPNPNAVEGYGSVTAMDGNLTVTGNGTAALKATNTEVITLVNPNSEANPGWWVGVKLEAPAGLSAEELAAAHYSLNGGVRKGFATYKDGDHYIWLYCKVTPELIANDDNGKLTCEWNFVWNELSKQSVIVEVDTSKVILKEADGTRVYPSAYGTLSTTLEGGTVEGAGTANTVLKFSNISVVYDTEAKAWRIPVTVTAPAHTVEAKEGENVIENTMTYYLELKPEKNFKDYVVDGELRGTFYWDGTQQEMALVAENITLLKAEQEPLVFEKDNEGRSFTAYAYTETFENKASGGSGDQVIQYESSDTSIATVDANGNVTFVKYQGWGGSYYKTGTVTITAKRSGNAYYNDAASISYTLNIQNEQWGLNFDAPGTVTVTFGQNGNKYQNKAYHYDRNNNKNYNNVSYELIYTDIPEEERAEVTLASDGTVTFTTTGKVAIKATKVGQGGYEYPSTTYTLVIEKGDQQIVIKQGEEAVEESTIIFTGMPILSYAYAIEGIVATNSETTATVDKENVADVEVADGHLFVTPKATGTVTITVKNTGDHNFNAAEKTITITVLMNENDAHFEQSEITVTYHDNDNKLTNQLIGLQDTDPVITYSSSDPEIAEVNATTGEVTIKKAGQVVITAFKAEDREEGYALVTQTYTLTVNKYTPAISFENTAPVTYVGIKTYQQLASLTSTYGNASGFVYEIVGGTDGYENFTGIQNAELKLLPLTTGTVTVKVTHPATDCYEEATATYVLNISYADVPDAYTLEGEKDPETNEWYKSDVTIKANDGYQISYSAEDGTWFGSLPYTQEGITTAAIYIREGEGQKGHSDKKFIPNIKIDKTAPTNLKIEYTKDVWGAILEGMTFGYYNADMTVTISAEDLPGNYESNKDKKVETSGVGQIFYNYNGVWNSADAVNGKITFTIAPEYLGKVSYYVKDVAGNSNGSETEPHTADTTIIVDTIKPGINVLWSSVGEEGTVLADGTRYYADKAVATVIIKEDNFFGGEGEDITREDGSFRADGVVITGGQFDGQWVLRKDAEGNEIPGEWQNTVTIDAEGDHVLTISYSDRSQNAMIGDRTENGTYTSEKIVIDETAPVITISEMPEYISAEKAEVTITVTEKNFDPERVEILCGAQNATENSDPVLGEWEHSEDGITHTITLTYPGDAIYDLTVNAKDLVSRPAEQKQESFTLDDTAPVNLKIEYSKDVWGAILEGMTFGYYNAEMTVTISAEDVTSGVATIHYNYNGKWESAKPVDGKIQFTIAPEYLGKVQYYAVDNAGNDTAEVETETTIIVDTIKPGVNVTWSEVGEEGKVLADGTRYYDEKAVATVIITEANFFGGEGENITRQDGTFRADGVVITGGKFDGQWAPAKDADGKDIPGAWQNTVTIDAEGDHVLTISYSDRSQNAMTGDRTVNGTYTSEKIVVDHTDPVIEITAMDDYISSASETVTITVTEKNFDDALVNIVCGAQSATANADPVFGQWKHSEDGITHTITLTYPGDAIYDLTVDAKDLSGRDAEQKQEHFTLDDTLPGNLTMEINGTVIDAILNQITFGYYNAPITVTLYADDLTAGVMQFDYQYVLHNNVSGVNQGGSGTLQGEAVQVEGNRYSATFQIPAGALTRENQFNGYISFTATDRCGNTSATKSYDGQYTVVVDNISPVGTITYNDPANQADGVSYYAGNIQAAINIEEANFDPNDVIVTVTKDGAAYPVNVAWGGGFNDVHTGAFTLTEDGDYVVTVTYPDKSGNAMAPYVSNQLTIDTQAPTIHVSDIEANSANKADPYGFTITMNDINLDGATVQAVLKAVMKNEQGNYVTKEIDLGAPAASEDGQTYTYTVENLPDDALYTLTYQVMDMSGNLTNTAQLDDRDTYGEVQFSINRKGSTFGFEDAYTETLVNQYYVYEVYEDVVIVEVNVDPIEDYVVMINGEELTEGEDYTSTQTSENDEWSKRTYVINKDQFAAEGEYNIVVSSKDKAETTSYSDVKNLSCVFVVDQTAPVLTISGLEEGGRYQTNEQTVTVIPTDEGGCLNSMRVVVFDAKGEPLVDEQGNDISNRFEMSGEEFLKYLEENDGKVTFTVPEGLNLQVQIICNDCATKADGTTNEYNETFEKVTVSQNQLVIFYANTPLFIGSIAGGLGLIFFLILLLKRKKDKKEEK